MHRKPLNARIFAISVFENSRISLGDHQLVLIVLPNAKILNRLQPFPVLGGKGLGSFGAMQGCLVEAFRDW